MTSSECHDALQACSAPVLPRLALAATVFFAGAAQAQMPARSRLHAARGRGRQAAPMSSPASAAIRSSSAARWAGTPARSTANSTTAPPCGPSGTAPSAGRSSRCAGRHGGVRSPIPASTGDRHQPSGRRHDAGWPPRSRHGRGHGDRRFHRAGPGRVTLQCGGAGTDLRIVWGVSFLCSFFPFCALSEILVDEFLLSQ